MVIYEVLTEQVPYHEFIAEAQIMNAIMKGRRPDMSRLLEGTPAPLNKIMLECMNADVRDRPRMSLLVPRLEDIRASLDGSTKGAVIAAKALSTKCPGGGDVEERLAILEEATDTLQVALEQFHGKFAHAPCT